MNTIHGYKLQCLVNVRVVSVAEGKRLRQQDLAADKSRLKYGHAPYVNPETYTAEEAAFMEA